MYWNCSIEYQATYFMHQYLSAKRDFCVINDVSFLSLHKVYQWNLRHIIICTRLLNLGKMGFLSCIELGFHILMYNADVNIWSVNKRLQSSFYWIYSHRILHTYIYEFLQHENWHRRKNPLEVQYSYNQSSLQTLEFDVVVASLCFTLVCIKIGS